MSAGAAAAEKSGAVSSPIPDSAPHSVAGAWLRALELTAPIPRQRDHVLPTVIEELAVRLGDAPALLSERECLSYRALAERSNRYARWALEQGVARGEVVALLMTNRPEYFAVWLGITRVGGVVALLNTNLTGAPLAHSLAAVAPTHLLVSSEFLDPAIAALRGLPSAPALWTHGAEDPRFRRIDLELEDLSGDLLSREERRPVTIDDRALYIYTSGTTGLPKAASVSHARVMQWGHWFAGMMEAGPTDRMYNCLPMYHSVGGVQAPAAALVAGGSVVLREKFSATSFWSDIQRWDCTLFQYIGELCRYLLATPASAQETGHRLRLACGNGMAAEVWASFQERFRIPRVLEFYASTEGGVSLFNVEGKPGAIGRIPPYLAHRFAPVLVRFDVERGEPVRDEQGFCARAAANEIGEALGRMAEDPASAGVRFEGYADPAATDKKVLRNVFAAGDAWVRTGDLMRKDERGFFYFVDRVGDTFRWKGENVATSEVAEAVCAFPGVEHAAVYGVAVPGADGRAGMAALVAAPDLDLAAFRRHLKSRLPAYARPLFLRIRHAIETTGTFKYSKTTLAREGFDPLASADTLYLDDRESQAFVPLDQNLYDLIQAGGVRL